MALRVAGASHRDWRPQLPTSREERNRIRELRESGGPSPRLGRAVALPLYRTMDCNAVNRALTTGSTHALHALQRAAVDLQPARALRAQRQAASVRREEARPARGRPA